MTISIRDAAPSDEAAWRELWAKYLDYYEVELTKSVIDKRWARIIEPSSGLRGRLAVTQEGVVGFALHHSHLSTWAEGPDCYLEDLFLDEAARGQGGGRALIDDLIRICRASGHSRLYWHTDEGNTRARALYDSYIPTDGHVRYRIKL